MTQVVYEPSTMKVSFGPQHPGSGHFRIILTLDGDVVVGAEPDPGYVHRGEEKMSEYRNYIQNVPHLERPVIHDSSGILYGYCLCVEELMKVQVPVRGQYIRMILAELNRMIKHLYYFSIYGIFAGHSTFFMWSMGDRELLIDLAEDMTGARVTHAHLVPGGVRNDIPPSFRDKTLRHLSYFEKRLKEYEDIFLRNPLFEKRTRGVGVLRQEDAIALGATGPTLRGSGIHYDTRKDEPYDQYPEIDFEIPTVPDGDSWARAKIHLDELYWSTQIIRQCLEKMPEGPVKVKQHPINLRVPAGEAYHRNEGAGGQFTHYLVSDGGKYPYRHKVNTPAFRTLAIIPHVLHRVLVADVPLAFWSVDYWPVEADR